LGTFTHINLPIGPFVAAQAAVWGEVNLSPANTTQATFDESRWPFVVITPPSVFSDADFQAMLARIRSYYERGQHFGLVMDIRESAPLQSEQRRVFVEEFDNNVRRFGSLLVGVGAVMTSAVQRGGFKALMWLRQTPEPPASAFSLEEDAMAWVRDKYQAGLDRRAGSGLRA
jgi:hypothetical protein